VHLVFRVFIVYIILRSLLRPRIFLTNGFEPGSSYFAVLKCTMLKCVLLCICIVIIIHPSVSFSFVLSSQDYFYRQPLTVPPDSLSFTGIPHFWGRGVLVPSLFKLLVISYGKQEKTDTFTVENDPSLCSTTVCSNCPLERMRDAYVFEFNYCCSLFTVQSSVVIQHYLLSAV
jgi:hypothetical protein